MMACVTRNVEENFKQREKSVLKLISNYDIHFDGVGIFGSYARGNYKSTSDIDFCIITNNRPSREVSGSLREDAELLGADIIFVTPEYFEHDPSEFAKQLRRDYRRLL